MYQVEISFYSWQFTVCDGGCGGAGQAVVQIARDRLNGLEYAIKLFLSRRTFNVRLFYMHAHMHEL